MDEMDDSSPEVTISPADNGHVVRWHQRSTKKDSPGRTIKRVASTTEEALGHAGEALGGGSRTKKKSSRSVGRSSAGMSPAASADEAGATSSAPAAHSMRSRSARPRRRARVSSRRA